MNAVCTGIISQALAEVIFGVPWNEQSTQTANVSTTLSSKPMTENSKICCQLLRNKIGIV